MQLILASTSPYRKTLLSRLGLPFETHPPQVDETPLPDENLASLALRLSIDKAWAIARRFPDAIVIGSDQVALLGDERFGKPGNAENAIAQLQKLSGQSVTFHTGVAVVHGRKNAVQACCVPTDVRFRRLSLDEIRRYVDHERPFDCAGSAKSEGLGVALLESQRSEDPTALIGLPLIALSGFLRAEGACLP